MLDIGWAELFVMAVIALLVVGPKELPAMLRTIGKFVAMIKRQAQDFRSQFDDAIKDTEFEQVKNDLQDLKSEATSTMRDVRDGFDEEMRELDEVRRDLDKEHAKLDAEMKREYGDQSDAESSEAEKAGEDWLEQHNRLVLEAEKANAEEAATAQEKPNGADEQQSTETVETSNTLSSQDGKADAHVADERQPQKAGAST